MYISSQNCSCVSMLVTACFFLLRANCLLASSIVTDAFSSLWPSHQRICTGGLLEAAWQLRCNSCPSMAVSEPRSVTSAGSTDVNVHTQRQVCENVIPLIVDSTATYSDHRGGTVIFGWKHWAVSMVKWKITLSGNLYSQEVFSMVSKVCFLLTTAGDGVR